MWLLAGSCSIIDAVMIMLMSNYQCFLMIFLAASKERLCGYWLKGEIAGHEERLCVVIRGCQTWIEEVWCDQRLPDLNGGGDISRKIVTKRESAWLEGEVLWLWERSSGMLRRDCLDSGEVVRLKEGLCVTRKVTYMWIVNRGFWVEEKFSLTKHIKLKL